MGTLLVSTAKGVPGMDHDGQPSSEVPQTVVWDPSLAEKGGYTFS